MRFRVREADAKDVFRDIARINELFRRDAAGGRIPAGTVCEITVRANRCYLIVRGAPSAEEPTIYLDERLRDALCVKAGDYADVSLKAAGWWGQFRWAWGASDPAYRVAARMALLSVGLGFLGLILGILSLVK